MQVYINGETKNFPEDALNLYQLLQLLELEPEQAGIAEAMVNQSFRDIKGKPGKPIPKEWKVRDILANVGARIRRDENGDYHLLATAITVPKTNNDTSLSVALIISLRLLM